MKSTEMPHVDKHKENVNEWYYDTNCISLSFPLPDLASF